MVILIAAIVSTNQPAVKPGSSENSHCRPESSSCVMCEPDALEVAAVTTDVRIVGLAHAEPPRLVAHGNHGRAGRGAHFSPDGDSRWSRLGSDGDPSLFNDQSDSIVTTA